MLRDNFMLIYQMCPSHNPKVGGEIDYLISVTQKQSVEEKLDEIFNFDNGDELSRLSKPENFHLIQEKCDMAFKIGLSRKQVYLQLWNRSNKRSVGDFKFLLDTFDYETIRK